MLELDLLTMPEALTLLGVSGNSFVQLVAAGKLPRPIEADGVRRWRKRGLLYAMRKVRKAEVDGSILSCQRTSVSGGGAIPCA